MANSAQRGSVPDDDSWGKIASDLFGIQFNDDDDFELPDDQAPVKEADPIASAPAVSSVSKVEDEAGAAAEFESESEVVAEELESSKKTSLPGNEDHDEFWDILESWNWDESAKAEKPARRSEEPRGRRGRAESAAPEPRRGQREQPPREQPPRAREEAPRREAAPRRDEPTRRPEPARSEESPRRDERRRDDDKRREGSDRPRRRPVEELEETDFFVEEPAPKSPPVREETRRERPPRAEQPTRGESVRGERPRRSEGDRPGPERVQGERVERRPERSSDRPRSRDVASAQGDDEFGSGVEQTKEGSRSRQSEPVRRREERPAPPPRRAAPARRPEPVDEFEGDLFVSDIEEEFVDDASANDPDDRISESEESEVSPQRRRRRRRRRRGRSTVEASSAASDLDSDEPCDPEEASQFDEADEDSREIEATDDEGELEEEREVRRPRRRRRRRGRRSETVAADLDADDADESAVSDDDDSDDISGMDPESESDDPDDEIVLPISYEGIPTWEEAISYLVITPPTESRGRGRHEGYRRDDSRRR